MDKSEQRKLVAAANRLLRKNPEPKIQGMYYLNGKPISLFSNSALIGIRKKTTDASIKKAITKELGYRYHLPSRI